MHRSGLVVVVVGGRAGSTLRRGLCDMDIQIDSKQLFRRYSPETCDFSNNIAWNQAFCPRKELKRTITPIIIGDFFTSDLSRPLFYECISVYRK